MKKIKKILAPTDLSDLSCVGVRYAMETAGERKAELIVYLVAPIDEDWYPTGEETNPKRDYVAKEKILLDRFLHDKFSDELSRLKITQKVGVGAAHAAIVAFAEQQEVDLIVMSTHGRTGLAHILIGSVAEKVVERSPCPVIVVPRPRPASKAA